MHPSISITSLSHKLVFCIVRSKTSSPVVLIAFLHWRLLQLIFQCLSWKRPCSRCATIAVYESTSIRFSTDATPGTDHAARSASSLSLQERTAPRKVTLPPAATT